MAQPPPLVPLADCVFNNDGVSSVMQYLRQHPDFALFPDFQLRGAAFGFLTAGAHADGNHDVPFRRFHPLYRNVNKAGEPKWRDGLRDVFMNAVMDHVVTLERASGGATILIHCPATRPPGTDAIPQEVKMEVFFPKALIAERPDVGIAFARIVQYFAEHVGVPAMERWDQASNSASWPGSHTPRRPSPYRAGNQPVIPRSPTPRCIWYGRLPGELDALIAELAPANLIIPPPPLVEAAHAGGNASAHTTAPIETLAVATQPVRVPTRDGTPQPRAASDDDHEEIRMLSPVGKEHIRLSYSSKDPYTPDDLLAFVEAHYDSHGNLQTESSSKARGKQRARSSDNGDHSEVDIADIVAALQARIDELEDINAKQELEIVGLRSALIGSVAGTQKPAVGSLRPDLAPTRTNTADTSARGGSRTPGPSARPASRADSQSSFSAISSVSSITSSSAFTTPPRARRGGVQHDARAPPPSVATMSPRPAPLYSPRPSSFTFGRHSVRVFEDHGLPSETHNVLQDVADAYAQEEWALRLRQRIFGCSAELASVLVNAMKKDRP